MLIDGNTLRSSAAVVTPQFIRVVGVQPLIGRYFLDEEYWNKTQGVAVVSHEFWSQRFNSDPSIVGRSLEIEGRAITVIGVMPKSFTAPEQAEILLPQAASGR
jgi:hypothetical protein